MESNVVFWEAREKTTLLTKTCFPLVRISQKKTFLTDQINFLSACLPFTHGGGEGAPCIENRGVEDNFIFYIEYRFFFVPVVKLR